MCSVCVLPSTPLWCMVHRRQAVFIVHPILQSRWGQEGEACNQVPTTKRLALPLFVPYRRGSSDTTLLAKVRERGQVSRTLAISGAMMPDVVRVVESAQSTQRPG
jgi:hypothetical protein